MKPCRRTLSIKHQEFVTLRDFIKDQWGILLGDDKAYLIENRLSDIVLGSGCKNYGEFYLKLKYSPQSGALHGQVVDAISTHETLWFRDQHPFRIIEEYVLPQIYEEIRAGKRKGMDIWSAACSTGQEPYSIAMTALDFYKAMGRRDACRDQVKILASDISAATVSRAMAARYDTAAMRRGLDERRLENYFKKEGNNHWAVNEKVKELVSFREFNLMYPVQGVLGPFDVIFLRNVIIYFSDEFKQILFDRISRLLNPGGYLFLGTGETVKGYTNAFEVLEHNGAGFYQVKTRPRE